MKTSPSNSLINNERTPSKRANPRRRANSREATILGLVGAGGIGLRLSERIQINAWDQVAYIIVLILIAVAAIDFVSKWLRARLIAGR